MEPNPDLNTLKDITSRTLNESLAHIHKLAYEGPASFKKNAGLLLGRHVQQEASGKKALPTLVDTVRILAQAHVQKALTFDNTPDAKKSLDAFIRDLKHIKLYLEEEEFSEIPEAKTMHEEIKRLSKSLKPKGKKRTHSEVEQLMLSAKVIALVGGNTNIISSLWKLGFITVDDYALCFCNGLESAIDDDSLQLILEFLTEDKEAKESLENAESIDLSQYPYLDAKAPAIVVKHLKNLKRTCFGSIHSVNRYLDYTVRVGNERIRTNKALLLEESDIIKSLADETTGELELCDPYISPETIKLFLKILIGEQDVDTLSLQELGEVAIFAEKYDCKNILQLIENECGKFDVYYEKYVDHLPILLPLYQRMIPSKGLKNVLYNFVNQIANVCKRLLARTIVNELKEPPQSHSPEALAELYGSILLKIVTEDLARYPEVCLVLLEKELYEEKSTTIAPKDFEDKRDFYCEKHANLRFPPGTCLVGYSYRLIESGIYLDLMQQLEILCERNPQAVAMWNIDLPRCHLVLGRLYSSGCKGALANGQLAEKHLNRAIDLLEKDVIKSYVPKLHLVKLYASRVPNFAPDLVKARNILQTIPENYEHFVVYLSELALSLQKKLPGDPKSIWETTRFRQLVAISQYDKAKRKEFLIGVFAYFVRIILLAHDKSPSIEDSVRKFAKRLYIELKDEIREITSEAKTTSLLIYEIANVLLVSALKRKLLPDNFGYLGFTAATELDPLLAKMEQTAKELKYTIHYSPCGYIYTELLEAARKAAQLTSVKKADAAFESAQSQR